MVHRLQQATSGGPRESISSYVDVEGIGVAKYYGQYNNLLTIVVDTDGAFPPVVLYNDLDLSSRSLAYSDFGGFGVK